MSRLWDDLRSAVGNASAGGTGGTGGRSGRSGGNRPLLAAAAVGMLVTFGAGWALGNGHDHDGDPSVLSSRTLAAESSGTPTSSAVPITPTAVPTGASTGRPTATPVSTPTPIVTSTETGLLPVLSKATKAPIAKFSCPHATVQVATATQLNAALAKARPGTVINLAAGMYTGEFQATRSGTAKKPIYLCGPRAAILDAGAIKGGYTLHLNGASYWRVKGFTVQDGQKGVMLDAVTGVGLQGLLVRQIGDEAVHLRRGSTRNVVRGLTIQQTGLRRNKFGEGVYIGTAQSNWCSVNNCQQDHSDGNFVLDNTIRATAAEAVDIKEGTSGGVLAGNTFDGSSITGADSWVDVKGNGWLIMGNKGTHTPQDGYQVHQILDGWGYRNLFAANTSTVDAGGYAIKVTKTHDDNVVRCNNKQAGAAEGMTNIPCQ